MIEFTNTLYSFVIVFCFFLLFFTFNVCVCVQVYMCMCMWVCVYVCVCASVVHKCVFLRRPEKNLGYCFSCTVHTDFGTRISQLPGTCQVGQSGWSASPRSLPSSVSPALGLQACTTDPRFCPCVLGIDLKPSCLCVCMVSTVSPQSLMSFFFDCF